MKPDRLLRAIDHRSCRRERVSAVVPARAPRRRPATRAASITTERSRASGSTTMWPRDCRLTCSSTSHSTLGLSGPVDLPRDRGAPGRASDTGPVDASRVPGPLASSAWTRRERSLRNTVSEDSVEATAAELEESLRGAGFPCGGPTRGDLRGPARPGLPPFPHRAGQALGFHVEPKFSVGTSRTPDRARLRTSIRSSRVPP